MILTFSASRNHNDFVRNMHSQYREKIDASQSDVKYHNWEYLLHR